MGHPSRARTPVTDDGSRPRYQAPAISDYGDLLALTREVDFLLPAGTVSSAAFASLPATPEGPPATSGGNPVVPEGASVTPLAQGGGSPNGAPAAGTEQAAGVGGADQGGGGGSGPAGEGVAGLGGGAGSTGSGELPFTGFAAGALAAAGALLSSAGVALRRRIRR